MIAVVIPSYKVKKHIERVISRIGPEVSLIYVVDDACPEQTGEYVQREMKDSRVRVLKHEKNLGVGGAVKTGYAQALKDGAEIVVKLDGDGQMDPSLIPHLCLPITDGRCDYAKGNRFFRLESLQKMPFLRLFGNAALSFITKISSGYWNVMDPTNGFTAIHAKALALLPLDKIDNRYFFESDMLFRLGTLRAVVLDMPMNAIYEDEKSNLKIHNVFFEFFFKHIIRMHKRIFYCYFLRDFNIASLQFVLGKLLFVFGICFGWIKWKQGIDSGVPATSGTVMLATLPIILGFQMILFAVQYDMQNVPDRPLQKLFR
jgi:dolichol-phosphate mannosyltransferase